MYCMYFVTPICNVKAECTVFMLEKCSDFLEIKPIKMFSVKPYLHFHVTLILRSTACDMYSS